MDLPLLQTLQKMKRMEAVHSRDYQPETIDLATFTPKYANVIVVDQRFHDSRIHEDFMAVLSRPRLVTTTNCESGVPVRNEFITNKLGHALRFCHFSVSTWGEPSGFTIVLKDGLYIFDDSSSVNYTHYMGVDLEFVGVGQVRFLFQKTLRSDRPLFSAVSTHLTLKNIRVYDMRKYRVVGGVVVFASHEAQISLARVFIHSVSAYGVSMYGPRSHGTIKDCTFNGCVRAFSVVDQSEIRAENVVARDISSFVASAAHDSKLHVSKSRFINHDRMIVQAKSTGFVKHCRFENEKWTQSVRDEEHLITAAEVVNESSLTCEHSFFRGFEWVVQASGSHSTACFSTCVATNVYQVATVYENANLTVTQCVLDCLEGLISLGANVKGKVKFTRNKLSDSTPRSIIVDGISKRPKHDVENVFITVVDDYDPTHGLSRKERSQYVHSVKQQAESADDVDFAWLTRSGEYKRCLRCQKNENGSAIFDKARGLDRNAKEKFRYCKGCLLASYCSKECQEAHWPDHRLWCKGKRKLDRPAPLGTRYCAKPSDEGTVVF